MKPRWKAGQCVRIDGITHRVRKLRDKKCCCWRCSFYEKEAIEQPCEDCLKGKLIPTDCNFEKIVKWQELWQW